MKRLEGTQIPRYTVAVDISTQEDKDIVEAFDKVIRGSRKRAILDLMLGYLEKVGGDYNNLEIDVTDEDIARDLHIIKED